MPGRLSNFGVCFQSRFEHLDGIANLITAMLPSSLKPSPLTLHLTRKLPNPHLALHLNALQFPACGLLPRFSVRSDDTIDAYSAIPDLLPRIVRFGRTV